MKPMNRLFYTPLGEWEIVGPKPNETIDALYKRLSRLARSYRTWGRAFRVEKRDDGVFWWRVEPGQHTKLAWWYRLPVGEPFVMMQRAQHHDVASAKATARYLKGKGEGTFHVTLRDTDLIVCRQDAPPLTSLPHNS